MEYCEHCGESRGEIRGGDDAAHSACLAALRMEPPRFCGHCRRRMVVQVTPRGWTARCVEHGLLTNA